MELFDGKVKLNLSIFDITKSVILIIVLVYAVTFANKAEKYLSPQKQHWDKTTISKIAEGVYKAKVAESNADLKAVVKALEASSKALQAVKANDEKIKELGQVVSRIEDNTVSLKGSLQRFKTRPTATLDTANFNLLDANGEPYTIGTVRYSPDAPDGVDRWSFNTWPRTINANVVLSEDEDGRPNRYIELWTQSSWEKDPNKRNYLKIDKLVWSKGEEKDKKFRFGPRIGFSGLFGNKAIVPALDYSLFSYGRTKVDMSWRFLDFSVGGNKGDLMLSLTPFSYNIGEIAPVISNMFVGPSIGYKLNDTLYNYALSISIPF